jgi:hypothetical protein
VHRERLLYLSVHSACGLSVSRRSPNDLGVNLDPTNAADTRHLHDLVSGKSLKVRP